MEDALELEDDDFFKELSKQISLLILDDEDHSLALSPPLLNSERESRRGTGVFIPRRENVTKPGRKLTASAAADEDSLPHIPSLNLLQNFTEAIHPARSSRQASLLNYDHHQKRISCCQLLRETKGTGVFIPASLPGAPVVSISSKGKC